MKKKTVTKKKPQPKPSTLLKKALSLLGDGKRWIKRDLKIKPKSFRDAPDNRPTVEVRYDNFEETKGRIYIGKKLLKKFDLDKLKIKERREIYTFINNADRAFYPEGAYCALGAIAEVNTKREEEAKAFLAKAIYPDFETAEGADAEVTIYEFNDDYHTNFSDLKKKFLKAIKLAEKTEK
jgi:hypothetical protein